MKKIILRISILAILIIVLFANVSFADELTARDYALIEATISIVDRETKIYDFQDAQKTDGRDPFRDSSGITIYFSNQGLKELRKAGIEVVFGDVNDDESYELGVKKGEYIELISVGTTSNGNVDFAVATSVSEKSINLGNNITNDIKKAFFDAEDDYIVLSENTNGDGFVFAPRNSTKFTSEKENATINFSTTSGKSTHIIEPSKLHAIGTQKKVVSLIEGNNTITKNDVTDVGNGKYKLYFTISSSGTWNFEGIDISKIYYGEGAYLNPGQRVHDKDGGTNIVLPDTEMEYYIELSEEDFASGNINLSLKHISDSDASGYDGTPMEDTTIKNLRGEYDNEVEWYEKIISWFIRLIGKGIQGLTSLIAGEELSIDKLVFDQYSRTNLFIFKRDAKKYGENKLVAGALDSLNDVFRLFSQIAITVYLIMLVYMGIRILTLSTNAGKQAKYKELLFDWVKGLIILYFFPYVMRYTILLNHAFVTYLYEQTAGIGIQEELQGASIQASNKSMADVIEDNYNAYNDENALDGESDENTDSDDNMSGGDDYMLQMYKTAEKSKRIADAIVWVIMLIQVLQFLIVYLQRLITVVFLVAIFPLVAISYAIDKIGDGKSQAFNNWTKEFILQVFIQSFHAVNYVLIMGIILSLPNENWFLKVIGITYVAKGGEILRKLFAQMKGGTGQSTLDVAKAMIKTNVAISGIKAIGNVASRTIGRNSMIGHGVGMISAARDTAIERRMVRSQRIAAETYDRRDVSFYGDGTAKKTNNINIHEITERTNSLLEKERNGTLTEEERKQLNRNMEDLYGLSEADLNNVLNGINSIDDKDKDLFRDAIFIAGAHRALNSKKKKTKVETRSEVDLELKFRNDPSLNKFATMYLGADNEKYNKREINKLKRMEAANSVSFANRANDPNIIPIHEDREQQIRNIKDSVRALQNDASIRGQSNIYWKTVLEANGDRELENAVEEALNETGYDRTSFDRDRKNARTELTKEALQAVRNAHTSSYTRAELDYYDKVLGDAKGDADLEKTISMYERKELHFSIDDFRKAKDVEVINHSHDDGADFKRTNEAIRHLKSSANTKSDAEILSNLRANFDDLEEDVLPELREERDENLAMQERAKREMANLSDVEMLGRMTQEQLQYLRDRESELTGKFRRQLARGVTTAAAGVAVGRFKLGTEVAVAGVATGATVSGKNGNMLEDIITVVPNAVKATEATLHTAGSPLARMENAAADKLIKDQKDADLKIIDESMKINDRYYRNQAALDKVERDISDAERERQDLLNKIEKKLNEKK